LCISFLNDACCGRTLLAHQSSDNHMQRAPPLRP
jgi:hypothetical protein